MPKLQITTPDGDETRYELDIESVKVGRIESNHIIIEEDSISGEHAALNLRAGGDYELSDLDSTNGTRLNGEKLKDPAMLKDGDSIRFGNVDAVYLSEVTPDATEELPPEKKHEPEIAEVSQTPQSFESMSPFKSKDAKTDGLGIMAIAISIIAIVVSLAVALLSTGMSAG